MKVERGKEGTLLSNIFFFFFFFFLIGKKQFNCV